MELRASVRGVLRIDSRAKSIRSASFEGTGLGCSAARLAGHKKVQRCYTPALSSLSRTNPLSPFHTNWPLRIAGFADDGANEPRRLLAAAEAGDPGSRSLEPHRSRMNQSC